MIALLGIVTVLLECIDRLLYFPKNLAYYAGIMLDAFRYLLCSKLYRHNWRKPKQREPAKRRFRAFLGLSYSSTVSTVKESIALKHLATVYATLDTLQLFLY